MSILKLPAAPPTTIIFDWHATLVDTHDAMYHAVDDVIPRLSELGLIDRLVKPEAAKTLEDAKLVRYVQSKAKLHPKIVEARKISRTDIFEVLFGEDDEAKKLVHAAFDQAYRNYVGEVSPFEPGIRDMLEALHELDLKVGVVSNRGREFMQVEVAQVENGTWAPLIDALVCGDDVIHRKPWPDLIETCLAELSAPADHHCWYVGDSTTDVQAAIRAGVTAVFYNGAQWDAEWIDKIFPGTKRHPYKPDAVANNFAEFLDMVRHFVAAEFLCNVNS